MASIETIKHVLKEIVASYPGRFKLEEDNVKAWTVYLADIDDELLMNAVRSFISSSTHAFPPSIPELRKEATRLRRTIAGVPDVWEAWEDLLKAGRGTWKEATDDNEIITHVYQFKHDIVENVARGLGWPEHFPVPGNEMADRAAFRDAYNEALGNATKEDMQLPQVRQYALEAGQRMKQLSDRMSTPPLIHPHTGERLE